jgi:hypothetical protein
VIFFVIYLTSLSWEDNIKMDLKGFCCEGVDWIDLAPDRDSSQALVNEVMNFRVQQNTGKFFTS